MAEWPLNLQPHCSTRRVRQKLAGTPHVATPTPKGFDLGLDLMNAKWFGLFKKVGLTSSYVHHVKISPNGRYQILDDKVTFRWSAGGPTEFRYERIVGRRIEVSFQKSWGITQSGEFGQITDYSFNSEERRGAIRAAADSLGLREQMPAPMVIALVFAVIGGLGAVLTLVVLWIGFLAR